MTTDNLKLLNNTSRKSKTYIKMNIIENLDREFLFLDLFEHIGEIRMFSYIIIASQKEKSNYYRHDFTAVKEIEKLYKIKPSTQHKYLKLLLTKEVLVKIQNGIYKVNSKYIELWQKQ